ncbi:relaxase/mobilization nuclease domain-containing protein [Rhodobacter sp. KR11]|uniref:relaxase/mobilization nuclease domain-containing protein n=1 Tax=Rhodobacter sp. KR11 TaxID=2974588 RepID=UPI002222FF98|nr:relaxase/mobilization nuclease domain-containing protein [Rhodobacter sp. KR11]MCW1920878.1 relaxase/mobilization nuclease domain-containing protein [Rhodobacter sp. KR11]
MIRQSWKDTRGHGLAARGRYVGQKAFATDCRWIGGDFSNGPEQMVATCKHHRHNPKTAFVHVMLSWREGEKPTTREIFAAADHALERLGAQGHEAIYGIHDDTKNIHVHILFSRVHPVSGRLLNLWESFKTLELACREIEVKQGWSPDNGRFDAIIDGSGPTPRVALQHKAAAYWALKKIRRMTGSQPRQCDHDFSRGSGYLPLQLRLPKRIIERIVGLCRTATDWASLHAGLADWGLVFRRTRRGAVIGIDRTDDWTCASHLAPDLSFPRLAKRLGDFAAAADPRPMPPMPKADLVLEGTPSEAARRLLALKWFAKDLPSRLHRMLTAHPFVTDHVSSLKMTAQTAHLSLSGGGWIRDQDGKIHVGGEGSPLLKCLAAVLMAQQRGWNKVTWSGDRSLGTRISAIAKERGLVGEEPGEIPAAPPYCLTYDRQDVLLKRSRQAQTNIEDRRKRQEIRDLLVATVDGVAEKIEPLLRDLRPDRRRLVSRALEGAMRKNAIETTDLRPAAIRLHARDAKEETGALLGALRHRNPQMNHPTLEFDIIDRLIGPLIARGPQGKVVLGDLVNLTETVVLLAHRDDGRICGYEFAVVDRTAPEVGRIRGSLMSSGRLPTGGRNPTGEMTVSNLGEVLDHLNPAMKSHVTLISLGQASGPGSYLPRPELRDQEPRIDMSNEEGYGL